MDKYPPCPSCYGKFPSDDCGGCIYSESCQWYSAAEAPHCDRVLDIAVPIDTRYAEFEADFWATHQSDGIGDAVITLRDLATFARYLLLLDDLTLGIIQDILRGDASLADVADEAGLSRQAVHQKITRDIKSRPELSILYMALMPRLASAKKRFYRKKLKTGKEQSK